MPKLSHIVVVIGLFFSVPAIAQQLTIVADSAGEQPTLGPTASMTVGSRTIIADEATRRVLVYTNPDLSELSDILDYPVGLRSIAELSVDNGQIHATDHASQDFALSDLANVSSELESSLEYRGERSDDGSVILSFANFESASLVPTSDNRTILEWDVLGQHDGRPVVYWVEIDGSLVTGLVGTPVDGVLEASAEVDLSQFDFLLSSPVHLDNSGQLWVLSLLDGEWSRPIGSVASQDRSALDQSGVDFFEGGAAPAGQGLAELEERAEYQYTIRDDSSADKALSDYDVIDLAMVSFAEQSNFNLVVKDGLTRDQIVSRALTYHTIPYFYRIRNSGDLGTGWERPTNLVGKTSTWQTGFRYYWSGYMSPIRHQQGLVDGHVVGDINTGTIISSGIVGCDCSGCVSAWLGIPRHTTSGIGADEDDHFSPVPILEARPGDIFNKAGSHVRMLLNKIETPSGTRFRMIESAKSCDGVCIRIYSVSDLKRYTPLTYNSILEED